MRVMRGETETDFSVYVGRRSKDISGYRAGYTHVVCVCLCVCARVHEDVCSKQCFGSN